MTDRNMSGVLFRETDKKSDRSPDYTGNLMVAGTKYRLAGWVKDGRNGKYLSLAATPAELKGEQPGTARAVPVEGVNDWQAPLDMPAGPELR